MEAFKMLKNSIWE